MKTYSYLADAVVVFHAMFVGFVVFGLVAILLGVLLRWSWVRNFWFRVTHLTMIVAVAIEAIFGITCPLTTLERHWRRLAGETVSDSSFMGQLAHNLLFYEAPQWIFSVLHVAFAVLVLATFVLARPRWPWRKSARAHQDKDVSLNPQS